MTPISLLVLTTLAAAGPEPARADPATVQASVYESLWTGWNVANRAAMRAEAEALRQVRQDVASADARRLQQLRDEGRPLGERVGDIVRAGDCGDGERVARQVGDFALVEAVRAHCRRPNDSVYR